MSHLYDAAGREQALWNVGAAGVMLAAYTASYDNTGNRIGVVELDGSLTTWGYDRSYQLTSEQRDGANAYNVSYLYDGVGNRTLKGDSGAFTTYLYNAANELTSMQPSVGQPTTSAWDANGNLRSENAGGQVTTYGWCFEDRMTGVSYPDGTFDTFTYREDGLRQTKVTSAGEIDFLWDEQNVLLETDGAGATAVQYTDYPGYWGGLASQRKTGASSFYGFDMSANSRLLASAAGAETDEYLYRAFGEEVLVSGGTVNPLRYGGREGYYRDLAARLYIRARKYEPEVGRWMSRDPIGFESGDFNLYRYVRGFPLVPDPSGKFEIPKHWPCSPPGWPCEEDNPPPCIGITSGYGKDFKQSGNPFAGCATCVSQLICSIIVGCELSRRHPVFDDPTGCQFYKALECQNSCMAKLWRTKDTALWKKATAVCRSCGSSTKQCCLSSVQAEQAGYTWCANSGSPPCGLPLSLFSETWRKNFGSTQCCSAAREGRRGCDKAAAGPTGGSRP